MLTTNKVTEIFYLSDEFSKEFEESQYQKKKKLGRWDNQFSIQLLKN